MNLFLKFLIGIFAVATFLISGYALVFVMLGMLPTIVAVFIDKRATRAASNTIGAFNILGMMPYILKLFQSGLGASDVAQAMLTNIHSWFVLYGSSGVGWLLIWIIPQVTGNYFVSREEKRTTQYKEEEQKLIEEWGPTVAIINNANKDRSSPKGSQKKS